MRRSLPRINLWAGRVGEKAIPRYDPLSPRRTRRADFPHRALLEALASGMHRQLRGGALAKSHESKFLEVLIPTLPFR